MAMTTGRVQVKVTAKATTSAPRAIMPAAPAKWASGVLATTATLAQALPAAAAEPATTSVPVTAVPVDDINIDSGVEAVIGAVKTAGDLVKSGINAVDSGLQLLQQGYEAAAPSINQGIQTVSPVLQQAAKVTIDTATPAFKAALPALQEAQTSLNGALGGLLQDPNVSTVVSTGQQAATTATPLASRAFTFLSGQDPSTLAEYGLGAFAFLFLAPKLLGVLGGAFRGYAGDITAAQVLDTLNDSSSVLIDIRTQKEKESSGVPDVPSSFGGRLIEVELAVTEDKKLRNALRDPNSIEAAVTSLRIASLKRVGKGTKVLLLDRYGNIAKAVAKELASKGFGKVYTVEGGFDGRNGWVQSKLQIKPAATVISAPLPFLGTRGTKKALPSPKA